MWLEHEFFHKTLNVRVCVMKKTKAMYTITNCEQHLDK